MDYRENIVLFLKGHGPALPVDVAKVVQKEIIFASAMLSEMASKGMVKISNLKVGGSPIYYLPEHADRLQEYIAGARDHEKNILYKLRDKHVLQDSALEPSERMALQSHKDFAVSITVRRENDQQQFWKWYLIPDEAAKLAIIAILEPKVASISTSSAQSPVSTTIHKEPGSLHQTTKSKGREQQTTISVPQKIVSKAKKSITPGPKNAEPLKEDPGVDTNKRLTTFFSKRSIRVLRPVTPRDKKERDSIVECPTPVGPLRAYCRYISKKKIADADVYAAWVEAQHVHLPLVLVLDGQVSKSVKEKIDRDFPGILLVNLSEVKG